jgi:hypothetical protein
VARRIRVPVDDKPGGFGLRGIAYCVGTLLIVLLGWYFVHSRSSDSSGVATPTPAPVVQQSAAPATDTASKPATNPVAPVQQRTFGSSGSWRVIAFTYSQEEMARQKAAAIAQEHPDLNPTVFTPNGRSPYLVTLGGQMSKQDAFAFSGKAKREGMPKDTYAQNYRGNGN